MDYSKVIAWQVSLIFKKLKEMKDRNKQGDNINTKILGLIREQEKQDY